METQAKEYERKIDGSYEELDKSFLRGLMKKGYLCAANCCEASKESHNDVQRCIENCTAPLMNAQTYVKNEYQDFQNRTQRCLMVCNDTIKAKMEKDKASKFDDKYRVDYESCAAECLVTHAGQLPALLEKILSNLQKHTTGL